MKVKHKNSGEVIDLIMPDYDKHWMGVYGYLIMTITGEILFCYSLEGMIVYEIVTNNYEIVEG